MKRYKIYTQTGLLVRVADDIEIEGGLIFFMLKDQTILIVNVDHIQTIEVEPFGEAA